MIHKFKFELETNNEREAKEITDFIDKLNKKYRLKIPEENNTSPFKLGESQAPKTLPQVKVNASGNLGDVSGSDTHSTKHIFQTIPKDSVSYLPSDTKQELNKEIGKDYDVSINRFPRVNFAKSVFPEQSKVKSELSEDKPC